jgi:hypothetical protein
MNEICRGCRELLLCQERGEALDGCGQEMEEEE